jgi:hypothetical protein
MAASGDNRSVNAGIIIGSVVTTGDHNTIHQANRIDLQAELAGLRQALSGLAVPEPGRLTDALDDAEAEAAKPQPDKGAITKFLGRALGAAKGGADFSANVAQIAPRVGALASWLGEHGQSLLSLLG